jgi:large subunit ribosomal protein L23
MNLENVIIAPIISEKSNSLQEIGATIGKRTTKYSFKVHPDANKNLVKQAIRKIYQATPSDVNIMLYKGKTKKFRNLPSVRPHWKKAIVTFVNGTKLEFGQGV